MIAAGIRPKGVPNVRPFLSGGGWEWNFLIDDIWIEENWPRGAFFFLLSSACLRKYRFTEGGNAGGDGETGWMAWRFGTI